MLQKRTENKNSGQPSRTPSELLVKELERRTSSKSRQSSFPSILVVPIHQKTAKKHEKKRKAKGEEVCMLAS